MSGGSLGPFGPLLGMGHRIAYLASAIVLGSICLTSTIVMFVLARTHNDLKQRGRYLVFWNGISATGIVTVYTMLNAFVGDFPCFILLWVSYLCIIPWLLTYLARGWRLVFIYNQQVDFGKRTLHRNSTIELADFARSSQWGLSDSVVTEHGPLTMTVATPAVAPTATLDSRFLTTSPALPTSRSTSPSNDRDHGRNALPLGPTVGRSSAHGSVVQCAMHDEEKAAGVHGSGPCDDSINNARLSASPSLPPLGSQFQDKTLAASHFPHSRSIENVSNAYGAFGPNPSHPASASITATPQIPSMTDAAIATISPFSASSHLVGDVRLSPLPNGSLDPANSNTSDQEGLNRSMAMLFEAPVTEARSPWNRYLPFNRATDGRLALFLLFVMIVPLIICIGMQLVKASPVQINPISYRCSEGFVFSPIYACMLGFLTIGCPILSYKLWWIKDGFGIRNELLINMMIGIPGFILYFISPLKLKKLDDGHWNHVNWLIMTIFLAHVNSVILPLIQFYIREIPKSRHSGKRSGFTSIFHWDFARAYAGTPGMDAGSETSSIRVFSPSLSQAVSTTHGHGEPSDTSTFDRQSIGCRSMAASSSVGLPSEDIQSGSLPATRSATTNSMRRIRGIKGFWAKYGKDAEGNIVPLSQMNPRAFEYALRDPEMLSELVKFSVTVFSAENTKFLQEYDGLRKQVREYFQLVKRTESSLARKHVKQLSSIPGSIGSPTNEGLGFSFETSPRSHKKKGSVIESVTSSIHSKFSRSDSRSRSGSNQSRRLGETGRGSPVHSLGEDLENNSKNLGPLGQPPKSFRRHRQGLKENLWRLSLQSSLRQSSTAPTSPLSARDGDGCGSDDGGASDPGESSSSRKLSRPPMSPRALSEMAHTRPKPSLGSRVYHSEVVMAVPDDRSNDAKPCGGGSSIENESDRSSLSWYGQGTSGSAISYHDVTPSELSSSYQDSGSVTDGYHIPMDGYGTADFGEHHGAGPSSTTDTAPHVMFSGRVGGCGANSEGHTDVCSESQTMPRSSDSMGSENGRDSCRATTAATTTTTTTHSRQPSRFGQSLQSQSQPLSSLAHQSPVHSPSASVSATFTPRLPIQPQLQSQANCHCSNGNGAANNAINGATRMPHSPSAPNASSPLASTLRNVLTAEEHHQQCCLHRSLTMNGKGQASATSSCHFQLSDGPIAQRSMPTPVVIVQQQTPSPIPMSSPVARHSRSYSQPPLLSHSLSIGHSHTLAPGPLQLRSPSRPDLLVPSPTKSGYGSSGASSGSGMAGSHLYLSMMPQLSMGANSSIGGVSVLGRRTPVPRALLPAYWEISRTFVMPNAVLELNLDEALVNEIRALFLTGDCYLEMYEPIVREVQELVYSNVWPRFVQSIQRNPQGTPGKFKRTWKSIFSDSSSSRVGQSADGPHGLYGISEGAAGEENGAVANGSGSGAGRGKKSKARGNFQDGDGDDEGGGNEGRSSEYGGIGRNVGGSGSQQKLQQFFPWYHSHSRQADPQGYGSSPNKDMKMSSLRGGRGEEDEEEDEKDQVMEEIGLEQYGVMQELDLSALQRIVVDPK